MLVILRGLKGLWPITWPFQGIRYKFHPKNKFFFSVLKLTKNQHVSYA